MSVMGWSDGSIVSCHYLANMVKSYSSNHLPTVWEDFTGPSYQLACLQQQHLPWSLRGPVK